MPSYMWRNKCLSLLGNPWGTLTSLPLLLGISMRKIYFMMHSTIGDRHLMSCQQDCIWLIRPFVSYSEEPRCARVMSNWAEEKGKPLGMYYQKRWCVCFHWMSSSKGINFRGLLYVVLCSMLDSIAELAILNPMILSGQYRFVFLMFSSVPDDLQYLIATLAVLVLNRHWIQCSIEWKKNQLN